MSEVCRHTFSASERISLPRHRLPVAANPSGERRLSADDRWSLISSPETFHDPYTNYSALFTGDWVGCLPVFFNGRNGGRTTKVERVFPSGGQRGTTVEVELRGKAGDAPVSIWASTVAVRGKLSDDLKKATLEISEDAKPGIHSLRFHNSAGASGVIPFVVGISHEVQEVEGNDVIDQATSIEQSEAIANGVLSKSGDVDVFGIELQQGKTFVAVMEANAVLGSPMDAVMQLLDEQGVVLAQNDDDFGFDPRIVWPVAKDGRYFIRTFAFPATPNSTIRFSGADSYVYRILMTTEEFIDHSIPLAVTTEQPVELDFFGWNLKTETLAVGADGDSDATRPDGAATRSGFRIPQSHIANLAETDQSPAPESRSVPFAASGRIAESEERDVWRFTGEKSQKVRLIVEARSLASLLDPVMRVIKPDGGLLKEYDDVAKTNLDVEATVTLPSDGEYQVELRDRFAHGGSRYYYLLSCTPAEPEFALSVAASQFILPEAGELEIPVTVTRKDKYDKTITITVADLPDGVTCEPVESRNGEDSAGKVTLKLIRDGSTSFSGLISIGGLANSDGEGKPELEDNATASIIGGTTTTTDLWLTVVAPVEKAEPVSDESKEDSAE